MDNVSAAQKLGFILDALGLRIAANVVEGWLQGRHKSTIPLSPAASDAKYATNHRWYIKFSDADLISLREQP
jgi:hypothetical protein